MRFSWFGRIAPVAYAIFSSACLAETTTVTIGETYGLTHLPSYVIVEQQLIEKEAAARGLSGVKVEFKRVGNGNVVANLLLSGHINVAMSGLVPFLYLWDKARARQPIKAIAALSQCNIFLMSRDPRIKSLADFRPTDRIAMTNVKSTTWAILLQMAAAKMYGWENRTYFDAMSVPMANNESMAAMLTSGTNVSSHMTMLPYTAIERASGHVHEVLNSKDIIGNPITAAVAFTTVRFHDQNPRLYAAIAEAFEKADKFIEEHPREAAEIYNRYEPQRGGVGSVLKMMGPNTPDELKFTMVPNGVKAFADFMAKSGMVGSTMPSWRNFFFENLAGASGS